MRLSCIQISRPLKRPIQQLSPWHFGDLGCMKVKDGLQWNSIAIYIIVNIPLCDRTIYYWNIYMFKGAQGSNIEYTLHLEKPQQNQVFIVAEVI